MLTVSINGKPYRSFERKADALRVYNTVVNNYGAKNPDAHIALTNRYRAVEVETRPAGNWRAS